jgi:multidrug efflux system outer membrane protein
MDPSPQANSIADLAWWELFKDPVLQGLIQEALKNNYDVRIAAARVEEERAQIGVTRSLFFPQVGYGANVSGQRAPTVPNHTYYDYNVNLSWELDLWGRIRHLNEQQRGCLSCDRRSTAWSLVKPGGCCASVLRVARLDAATGNRIGDRAEFQETLDLFSKKFEGGAASGRDLASRGCARQCVSPVPDLQRQITAKENQINLLLGKNPGPIPRGDLLTAQNDLDGPGGTAFHFARTSS